MKKPIIIIVVIAIIGIGGYVVYQSQTSADVPTDEMMIESKPDFDSMMKDVVDTMVQDAMTMEYDYEGKLTDVSGGSSSGTARANYSEGNYTLLASFQSLPEPDGTDFYEGWVVRKSPLSIISTGKAELDQGGYLNVYMSGQDLTDHDFYVLTLEPDDGDPAPAKHIVEGVMKMTGDAVMDAMKKDGDGMVVDKGPDGGIMEQEKVSFSGAVLAGTSAPLLDYNKSDYDKAIAANKKIAIYFYANWCPTCKKEFPKMQSAFNHLNRDDVVGFRVNFNDSDTDSSEKELAKQFGVAYQHTKVFVKNGQRILKSPETWDEAKYLSEINAQFH